MWGTMQKEIPSLEFSAVEPYIMSQHLKKVRADKLNTLPKKSVYSLYPVPVGLPATLVYENSKYRRAFVMRGGRYLKTKLGDVVPKSTGVSSSTKLSQYFSGWLTMDNAAIEKLGQKRDLSDLPAFIRKVLKVEALAKYRKYLRFVAGGYQINYTHSSIGFVFQEKPQQFYMLENYRFSSVICLTKDAKKYAENTMSAARYAELHGKKLGKKSKLITYRHLGSGTQFATLAMKHDQVPEAFKEMTKLIKFCSFPVAGIAVENIDTHQLYINESGAHFIAL